MTQHLHVVDTHSNDLPTNMQVPCDSPTVGEREPVLQPARPRPAPPRHSSRSGTFWNPPTPQKT